MSQNCVARREPERIAAGDSLVFTRYLRDYLPSDGWSLLYCLGGDKWQNIQFTSTPDITDTAHQISVPTTETATWLPGDALLVGYAVNNNLNPPQREQFYRAELTIAPDFPAQEQPVPVWTFAQKMLQKLEVQLLNLADLSLEQTRTMDVEFRYERIANLRAEHGYWTMVRRGEVAKQRAEMGMPPQNRQVPRMVITFGGPVFGEQIIPGAYLG
jgi:hypothetical protein